MIVHGIKTVENRTWATQYRGPIAICASSRSPAPALIEAERQWCRRHGITFPESLPIGGVVGIVDLVGIFRRARRGEKPDFSFGRKKYVLLKEGDALPTEEDMVWYAEEGVGWLLANPRIVDFFPIRGRLGLYEIQFNEKVHNSHQS